MVTSLSAGLLSQTTEDPDGGMLLLATASLSLAVLGAHAAVALLVHSPSKLQRRAKGGKTALDDFATHTTEFLVLSWVLALGGNVGAILLADRVSSGSLAAPLGFAFAALLLCGGLPLAIAEHHAEQIVLHTLPILRALRALLRYPIVLPLLRVTHWTMRVLRIAKEPSTDPEEIADEIMAAVTDSVTESPLQEEERSWIENIVDLKDRHVSEAMTPRTDVVALRAEMPLRDAIARAVETGYSRYPVFETNVDNVIGVFYAKDALAHPDHETEKLAVRELLRDPLFVPESMQVIELLQRFKTQKVQMAVVLDEYGGTAGLITIEDIIEEILGDISDEYDPEEEASINVIEKGRIVEISGKARVDEVNETLDVAIPENAEYDTVAGYVFNALGKIPKPGETHRQNGLEFEILGADERRIDRIRVTVRTPEPSDSSG